MEAITNAYAAFRFFLAFVVFRFGFAGSAGDACVSGVETCNALTIVRAICAAHTLASIVTPRRSDRVGRNGPPLRPCGPACHAALADSARAATAGNTMRQ